MQNQIAPRPHGVPESFYSKFGQFITAVLTGFDRIRFRATLRIYPGEHQAIERRRQSAAITRKLTLLRAHGLIRKVSGSHRYVLSQNGRRIITALLAARHADIDQLTRMAA